MASALFVRERLCTNPPLFAVIPVSMASGAESDLCGNQRAATLYLAGCDSPISCTPVRDFDMGGLSQQDELRFGQCSAIVRIDSGVIRDELGFFLLPNQNAKTTTIDVEVLLERDSSFDTAGAQANLWLSAYSEIKYQGFLGKIDRLFLKASKSRKLQSGDTLVVEYTMGNSFPGVLELVESNGKNWRARLHIVGQPAQPLTQSSLVSIHRVEIDGIAAVFRCILGRIFNSHS